MLLYIYFFCYFPVERNRLVPAQRVLRHNGGTDHLGALAARYAVTSTDDRGTLAHLVDRARALVQLLSLAVTTSNPEHSRTVGGGTSHGTDSNAGGASATLAAARGTIRGVVSAAAAVAAAAAAAVATVRAGGRVGIITGPVAGEVQRNSGVNHAHQGLNSSALLLGVEKRVRVVLLRQKLLVTLSGEVEDGKSGVVASLLPVVVRLESEHLSLGTPVGKSMLQGLRNVLEDLRRRERSGGDE